VNTALAEAERLAALHAYRLLDAPADTELTALVRVAATVAGVPTATPNLLDEHRQCQLTTVGFEGADSERSDSMCDIAVRSGVVTYVPDARRSAMFAGNPWVTGRLANVRFYTSVPLVAPEGHILGTLCVFDEIPRELADEAIRRLEDLARVVVALFERRREARLQAELAEEAWEQRQLFEVMFTELEEAQRQLSLRSAELERSNTDLQHFAAITSHDLAAPLTAIGGYLELLDDLHSAALDPQARSWLATARAGVVRMHDMMRSLLSYATVDAAACRRERTDLNDVVEQVLVDLGSAIEDAGARVTYANVPALYGDPVQLRQLLQNLISNSLKYRRADRPCRIGVRADRCSDGWTVRVVDNGRGIPPAQRGRAFAMYARVDSHDESGHGIGLATCQRIVERHGGRIWAEETPGGGLTVCCFLPQRAEAVPGQRSVPVSADIRPTA
jgi:signal transduction histidine kinase